MENLILMTDSYKTTHYKQYPKDMTYMFDYIESRGGSYGFTRFFGLQYYLKKYFSKPITKEMIDEAQEILSLHGVEFNREGWEYILKKHNGYLPIRIRAVEEGTVVPNHNVLVTVESTDPKVAWIVGYIETLLLKVWFPITVATLSYKIHLIIKKFLSETAENLESLPFQLHDFGYRGVSSEESAGIGGLAHLINFKGTDTLKALLYAKKYYNEKMAGYSVPASEHSTTTSWTKEGEVDMVRNMLKQFPDKIVSIVADSYNYFYFVDHIIGEQLRNEIINRKFNTTIRPDSGDAITNVLYALESCERNFGAVINSKGYKILNKIRILQGDGINEDTIWDICKIVKENGYSVENIIFGCGGALLQGNAKSSINRDTHKFAMKCSAVKVEHELINVFKNPITDRGKISQKGRLDLIINDEGEYETVNISILPENSYHSQSVLKTVFENGKILKEYTLEEIRNKERE